MTHRQYYRRFRLNAAQYGEILVAEAFRGKKMGDAEKGFDVLLDKSKFCFVLEAARIDVEQLLSQSLDDEIKIQVKSKLTKTTSGVARVVNVQDVCIEKMTHLAIVLVNSESPNNQDESLREGLIEHAWLMTRQTACSLREKEKKVQYIGVSQLLNSNSSDGDIVDIAQILNVIAETPIEPR